MVKDIFSGLGKIDFGFGPRRTIRESISKGKRDAVWIKYMGNKTRGKCYCCKIRPIHFTDFEVGHNKAVAKGGRNNINNLRPICRSCNREMRTKSIEWWKEKHYGKPTKREENNKKGYKKRRKSLFDQYW